MKDGKCWLLRQKCNKKYRWKVSIKRPDSFNFKRAARRRTNITGMCRPGTHVDKENKVCSCRNITSRQPRGQKIPSQTTLLEWRDQLISRHVCVRILASQRATIWRVIATCRRQSWQERARSERERQRDRMKMKRYLGFTRFSYRTNLFADFTALLGELPIRVGTGGELSERRLLGISETEDVYKNGADEHSGHKDHVFIVLQYPNDAHDGARCCSGSTYVLASGLLYTGNAETVNDACR